MMLPVDVARLDALIDALRAFRAEWDCDQVDAVYVTDGGELTSLVVGRTYACVQAEDGGVVDIRRWEDS